MTNRADELLRELWTMWNDPQWCRMKAGYLRGHLSYANSLGEKERDLRAYLNEKPHEPTALPFIVKHYSADERPIIKGNGFDGLEVGTTREEAETFVAFVNQAIKDAGRTGRPIEASAVGEIPALPRPASPPHAAAEPEKPRLHEFQRKRIVRACEEAEHPIGMSTHSGYARVLAHDVRKLLAIVDASPSAQPIARIREAINEYYAALCRREHGGLAQNTAFNKIEQALWMTWEDYKAAIKSAGKE